MSTNSTITVITEKDKEAKRIYCHWDGYPSWVGAMLLEHYNSFEKAKALVELGDISSLRERLAPKPGEQHSFEKPLEDVTIFYGRDRGETGVEPVVDHPDIIFFPSKSILREYNYMFDGEKWLLRPKNAKQWQELTRKICDLPELEEQSEKERCIRKYLEDGFIEADVTAIKGVCNAFTGSIDNVKGIQTDTDGSKYVTVIDQEDNAFDVPLDKIDLPQDDEDYHLEHAVINQIEADLEAKEYDGLSQLINSLLKDENTKKQLIEYLTDTAKEIWLEGKTNIRY